MNSKFVLAVFAALFIAQNAASTLDALHRMEENLKQTMEFLTIYKEELPAKGDQRIDDFLTKQKNMVARMIERTLQRIDKKVEEAGVAGETVQNCKATAESELENAKNTVIPQLEKCTQDNKPDWSPLQAETSEVIAKGEIFHNEIQAIETNCAADPATQEKCVGMKLPEVGRGLGLFHATVGKLKGKVGRTAVMALKSAGSCSKEPLRTFRNEQNIAMKTALTCIESAQ